MARSTPTPPPTPRLLSSLENGSGPGQSVSGNRVNDVGVPVADEFPCPGIAAMAGGRVSHRREELPVRPENHGISRPGPRTRTDAQRRRLSRLAAVAGSGTVSAGWQGRIA